MAWPRRRPYPSPPGHGNCRISRCDPSSGSFWGLHDSANRLTNANSGAVVIVYDASGNRIKKVTATATNLYLVSTVNPSGYAQVVEEFTVAGGGGATNLSRAYSYGLDLISQR